jgi:catechol 2,3-dioxygenase-like lactoylglutathione lyase family enzyme
LRHWNGVRRSSLLNQRNLTMDTSLTLGALGQISRSVRDIRAAEAWYRDTLGITHLYTFGNLAFFDCGGVRLFLAENESETTESILYFRVVDIHGVCAALTRRGVEFVNAPHMIHKHADGTEEWMAFFKDNEGRSLALMEQVRA